jgi:DNA-binding transcriptional regulator LsrR (DeoR family)
MANQTDREETLAFVAEKYYLEDHKQTEIAEMVGLTRSAISRMLTEAREKGIVEIIVHYPFRNNSTLEDEFTTRFGLKHITVLDFNKQPNYDDLRKQLGKAGARLLSKLTKPGSQIGVAWGTTVQATIEAFDTNPVPDTKVVQMVGVLGSTRHSYSAQTLVERLAHKLNGEGYYLYSPFIVENAQTAASLLEDPSVEQAIAISRDCDVALMGIGTTKPELCSLFRGGHITLEELDTIRSASAVGDVCAIYYEIDGSVAKVDFNKRRIGTSYQDLMDIETRLAVAGNPDKSEAVLGAIRGGFINALVTDKATAQRVLDLDQG